MVHAASATSEVDEEATLEALEATEAEELGVTEITVDDEDTDDALEDVLADEALDEDEVFVVVLTDVDEVLVVARRTIFPIPSAPHK